MSLYDRIGGGYDSSRKADPQITQRLMNHLQVSDGSPIVDVACGTGNYTVALSKLGVKITGTDISEEMLQQARKKAQNISWDKADVTKLPYENGSFMGATCVLAIHHFEDLSKAFREIFRVIHRGRFVIFTASPEQMMHYWLNEYFPNALRSSYVQMPKISDVIKCLKQAGFRINGIESFLIQPDIQDFFLYSGKHKPHIYLSPNVRAGISTFTNLASIEEVREGCIKLEKDINIGRINEVMESYSSDLGDYLFIVAEK